MRVERVLFHRPRLAHRRLCSRELLHGGCTRCSRTCCKTMTVQLLLNWSFTPMRRETRMVTRSTQLCPRGMRMGGDFSEAVHAGSRTLRAHQRVHSERWKELVRAVQIGNSENRAVLFAMLVAHRPFTWPRSSTTSFHCLRDSTFRCSGSGSQACRVLCLTRAATRQWHLC